MNKYWLIVGKPDSWQEAFEKGNIWGFIQRQKSRWDALKKDDVVLFYATKPVAGVIGHGSVQAKFRQDKPLWSDEIKQRKVIWPLRFEFDVHYCLPRDKWETERITSDTVKLKVAVGSQTVEPTLAEEIISQFKKEEGKPSEEVPLHKEIKQKLIEIGKLQNYLAEEEYPFDIGKLDVVWRRVELSVPTRVFEIQIGGDIYHALSKLKHAYDLWNSHLFLVASNKDHDKFEKLVSGTFHEIRQQIRFIKLEEVEELYKQKKTLKALEKEMGI